MELSGTATLEVEPSVPKRNIEAERSVNKVTGMADEAEESVAVERREKILKPADLPQDRYIKGISRVCQGYILTVYQWYIKGIYI